MAKYDSQIMYDFADDLYSRADFITIDYTLIGGLIGAFLGYAFGGMRADSGLLMAGIGLIIVGAIGYFMGSGKAFELKVQAQSLLCQVAIEENTRKSGGLPIVAAQAITPSYVNTSASPVASPPPASSWGRKCRDCGADLPVAAEFCPKCSAPIA